MARFTYAQVLNVAQQRHPKLRRLVLDDNVVVLDVNQLVLEMLDQMGQSDLVVTQQSITYAADIQPNLAGAPALASITSIDLPTSVTKVLAVEAIYGASGRRREVDVRRLESKVRDRPRDDTQDESEDNLARNPIAYLVWRDGLFVLRKHSSSVMWDGVTDLELVVASRTTPAATATLTTTVPLPERALRACAEKYALLLGRRAGLREAWLRTQERIAINAVDRVVEWAGDFLATDEPFDPDVQ